VCELGLVRGRINTEYSAEVQPALVDPRHEIWMCNAYVSSPLRERVHLVLMLNRNTNDRK
jgi:hypothetical protein